PEPLSQALETERGAVAIYQTAIRCALNGDLKKEWTEYLEQTQNHEKIVTGLIEDLGLELEAETAGRIVVRHIGQSLVQAMEMALEENQPEAAQLVATECVVLAETKDHQNCELLALCAEKVKGELRKALVAAQNEVEDEEDEHLYHSSGWSRELWIESLGLPAVLPPPEEEKEVTTAIGAARAKQARKKMIRSSSKN